MTDSLRPNEQLVKRYKCPMAPGTNTKTLNVGGCSQSVRIVGTDSRGCGTGDTVYTLEDEQGRRSRWFVPGAGYFGSPPNTGETRGTLG